MSVLRLFDITVLLLEYHPSSYLSTNQLRKSKKEIKDASDVCNSISQPPIDTIISTL